MNKVFQKKKLAQNRRWRIRRKISGTAERPRLSLRLSNQHIYAQCVDDEAGRTIVYLSSLSKEVANEGLKPNAAGAVELGKRFAAKAREAGIEAVVFDRGGRLYHGVVKAFADTVRENGLKV